MLGFFSSCFPNFSFLRHPPTQPNKGFFDDFMYRKEIKKKEDRRMAG